MAINEQIVTGRKFRKLVDEATKLWQRISFWTKAVDVEFNDSKTAETKLGAIDGITDSLVSTSSRIAASAKAVNELNNNLIFPDGTKFYPDIHDGSYGFNTNPQRGADTFCPFSSEMSGDFYLQHSQYHGNYYNTAYITFNLSKKYKYLDLIAESQNGNQSKMYVFDETFSHGSAGNQITTFTGSKILTKYDISAYDKITIYAMWVTYPNGNGEYKGNYRFYN